MSRSSTTQTGEPRAAQVGTADLQPPGRLEADRAATKALAGDADGVGGVEAVNAGTAAPASVVS